MKLRIINLGLDHLAKTDHPPRSAGVHQSDIIKHILNKLDPKRYGRDFADLSAEELLQVEMGFLWEDVVFSEAILSRIFDGDTDSIVRNLELEEDDIFQTLDGYHARRDIVIEVKYTGMFLAEPQDPKFRHWFWQNMGYCRTARTLRSIFVVLFHLGDGRRPSLPKGQLWKVRYTAAELEKNWRMLLVNRDEMLREGRGQR